MTEGKHESYFRRQEYGLELANRMFHMTVEERVDFVDAFADVLKLYNPNLKLMLLEDE